MEDTLDLAPVKAFLDGETWNTIVHEACDLGSQSANELLELIHLQIDSLAFFLEKDIENRTQTEYNRLIHLISHIENRI